MLAHSVVFDPREPAAALAAIPAASGVFALFGADARAEPYLGRTPNLRRRLRRFLDARPTQSRRLQLAEKVARIEYSLAGSDFECSLQIYAASMEAFGERARKRLHIRAPTFLRMASTNAYPRVYATNKISRRAADDLFGPFPSRTAAERFCEEMLNLFLLRRCHEELHPDPMFPGCVYSEMKMCLAPCFKGCSDERYAHEAAQVHAFLATRGASLQAELAAERDAASANLEFEAAAALHGRIQKVQAAASLASEAVHPLSRLSGVIVQPAVDAGYVALFLLEKGRLAGPALFSVAGMRHPNEQSGSSSLFAHPVAIEAVPLEGDTSSLAPVSRDVLDQRLAEALAGLRGSTAGVPGDSQALADHIALFARWYYRPQTRRGGEVLFAEEDGQVPSKPLLRAISRVFRAATASPAEAQFVTTAAGGQGGQTDTL
jgi:excinuclease ABC subunit C